MILFKPAHVPMILKGKKTETRRIWKAGPRIKVGRVYGAKTKLFGKDFARIEVLGLWKERLGDISEESVRAEGYDSLEDYKRVWIEINKKWDPDTDVWVVKFRLAGGL